MQYFIETKSFIFERMQAFFKATARTPPNHPRHRLTTSPSPPVSAGRGAKCGDEHHIPVEWQAPPPAWIAARRRRHVVEPSERLAVCVGVSSLILILLLLLALVVVAIVRGCSFILSSCIGTTLSTLHGHEQHSLTPLSTNEDNPNPKIVWLMSFPNRYAWFCVQSYYSLQLDVSSHLDVMLPAVLRLSFT